MKQSIDRILTTHVGSLPRPKALLDSVKGGDHDAALRTAIAEVVRQQAAVGLDIVNEGEFGKSSWASYILERVTGFEVRPGQMRPIEWMGEDLARFPECVAEHYPGAAAGMPTEACVGPIRYRDDDSLQTAIVALKSGVAEVRVEEAFMTAVAPASTAYNGVNEFYATDREYVFALADALREEYLAIHKSGLLVQVDDAVLANMHHALVSQSPERYREWAELRVEALNHALRGIPQDRVRYHICFGSWHVPHISDAPLEEIVDLVLAVNAGAYSIEAANPRHEHEWRVWETAKLPPEKILIPGVITHHIITVEHPQVVADRILRFANIVGRERVIAGTDCGFAQSEGIRRVDPKVMWAKFESLVAGARIASDVLWGRRSAA